MIAWTSLVLLNLAIVEFLVSIRLGTMLLWYSGKNDVWRAALTSSQLAFILGFCVSLSHYIRDIVRSEGELGIDEIKVNIGGRRSADS